MQSAMCSSHFLLKLHRSLRLRKVNLCHLFSAVYKMLPCYWLHLVYLLAFNQTVIRNNSFSLNKMRLLLLSFISCVLYQNVVSYKFLAILPIPSKSHYYIGQNLMKGLAEDGHEVTVISPFKEKTPIKNYKEVFLEHTWVESRKCNYLRNSFENESCWNCAYISM